MNQRLTELYSHVSVHATADREHEAAVELLLLVKSVTFGSPFVFVAVAMPPAKFGGTGVKLSLPVICTSLAELMSQGSPSTVVAKS